MSNLPPFKVIAAIEEGRGLGLRGDLPWHLPADLKHFADTTTTTQDSSKQNAVIMGRLTCETIPEKYWPLRGRRNAVITRNTSWSKEGADVYPDLPSALRGLAGEVETLFVVGGGQIYTMALQRPECEELILTRIDASYECDAFFPEFTDGYHLNSTLGGGERDGVAYRFERWYRTGTTGSSKS